MTLVLRFRDASDASGQDLVIHVPENRGSTNTFLWEQLRQALGQQANGKWLRIFAGGRELQESDPFPTAVAQNGALFIFTLSAFPQHAHSSEPSSPLAPAAGQQNLQPPAQDWLDILEPGNLVVIAFGLVLGLFWLLFLCFSSSFDFVSIAILVLMTVAFVTPFTPLPTHVAPLLNRLVGLPPSATLMTQQEQQQQQQQQQHQPQAGIGARAGSGSQERVAGYIDASGNYIPPRPPARRRPSALASNG